ncbi:hypothetical protein Tco_1393211 [Tanacetum coccineum]
MDEKEVNKWNDLNKEEVTVKISCNTVVEDVADRDTVIEEVTEISYGISIDYHFESQVISMESQMIHVESHEIHIESRVIYLESNVIHIDQ